MYAEHFDLLKYIRFNTIVTAVQRAKDFDSTGQWTVTFASRSAILAFREMPGYSAEHFLVSVDRLELMKASIRGRRRSMES